jgi:integrase
MARVRENLPSRNEPYWMSLGKSQALGYRRCESGVRTWIGRWTEPDIEEDRKRPKYVFEALGPVDDRLTYTAAVKAAGEFFKRAELKWKTRFDGEPDEVIDTNEEACKAYVRNLEAVKGKDSAYDAEHRFKKHVYGKRFGRLRWAKLTAREVERWRNGLVTEGRQRNSANRIFRVWIAAMNWASARCSTDGVTSWKFVKEFPVEDGSRKGYLTFIQRTALLEACDRDKDPAELEKDPHLIYCTPDLGNLLRGHFFAGARPGELVKARVQALDVRAMTLTLISCKNKKGEARPRVFFLYEPAALEFFKRMAKDKLPLAFLMTRSDGSAWVRDNGRPRYREWGRGIKAAIRLANARLEEADRIPEEDIVLYVLRHIVITDMLSEDKIDQVAVEKVTGTSAAMIKKHYYKVVEERLKKKLAGRRSL